ncbi:MAG: cell division protein ZapA [Treponema sp.]|jgi:cell division protein ZapA|nr:cell division protein ZapA [Treponema sp.]
MGNLQIDILGTSFAIKANEDSEYLNKLLGYYKRIVDQIEKSGSLKTPLQISILSGIMLCDELYKEKGRNVKFQSALEKNSTDEEADRITKSLIEKIDQVLK